MDKKGALGNTSNHTLFSGMKWWKRKSDPKVSITLLANLRRPRLQCSCYSQKKMSKWFCYSITSKSIHHLWKFQMLLVWMLRCDTFKGKYKSQLYPYKQYSLFWSKCDIFAFCAKSLNNICLIFSHMSYTTKAKHGRVWFGVEKFSWKLFAPWPLIRSIKWSLITKPPPQPPCKSRDESNEVFDCVIREWLL